MEGKEKNMETSGGGERNVEENGRRKVVEEVSDDDDSSSEDTDPDPDVDIVEEEEDNDPDIVIIADEEVKTKPDIVNVAEEEEEEDEDEESDPDATSYYKSEFESTTDDLQKNPKKILEESEFLKFIVDSIKNVDDRNDVIPQKEKEHVPVIEILPLVFRFEVEEPFPPEKEEWEKEIEDLFSKMNMCILESNIGFTNPSVSPM